MSNFNVTQSYLYVTLRLQYYEFEFVYPKLVQNFVRRVLAKAKNRR